MQSIILPAILQQHRHIPMKFLNSINGLIQSDNETAHKILLECLSKLNQTGIC